MSGKGSPSGIIPLTSIGDLGNPFGALAKADKALKDKKTGKSVTDRALTAARHPKVGQAEKQARVQYINDLWKKYKNQGLMTEGDYYAARLFGGSHTVKGPQMRYEKGVVAYGKKREGSSPVRAAGKPKKYNAPQPSLDQETIRNIRGNIEEREKQTFTLYLNHSGMAATPKK